MNPVRWIVRKKLRKAGAQTVLLITAAALAAACLLTLFSLSAGYVTFYCRQAERFGLNAWETAQEGLLNITKFIVSFKDMPAEEAEESCGGGLLVLLFAYLEIPEPPQEPAISLLPEAADLFSARAALRNLPAILLLTNLGGVLTVVCAVSLLFSVFRNKRRHFYASLLVSGASALFIKRCAAAEALALCAVGIPVGSLLGAAATVALKAGAGAYMCRGGMEFPVPLKITPLSAAAAGITVLLLMLLFSLRSCRNLSVRNASAQMRGVLSADIGIRTFTDDSRKYRILGIPHYIALRNISNHLGKYARIFLMTAFCMTELGTFLLSFTMIGNSNLSFYYAEQKEAMMLIASCRFFFYAAAGSVQLFAMAATVFGMLSNVESNDGIYALMRSAGASPRCVRRTIRREGLFGAIIGVLIGMIGTLTFAGYVLTSYDGSEAAKTVHTEGSGMVLAAMAVSALCYIVTVAFATEITIRRNNRTDVVKTLKELAYS